MVSNTWSLLVNKTKTKKKSKCSAGNTIANEYRGPGNDDGRVVNASWIVRREHADRHEVIQYRTDAKACIRYIGYSHLFCIYIVTRPGTCGRDAVESTGTAETAWHQKRSDLQHNSTISINQACLLVFP